MWRTGRKSLRSSKLNSGRKPLPLIKFYRCRHRYQNAAIKASPAEWSSQAAALSGQQPRPDKKGGTAEAYAFVPLRIEAFFGYNRRNATMTEKLYQTDSYIREFDARVVGVTDDGAIILNRTAFFPGGGGQPFDMGVLSIHDKKWPVLKTQQSGGQVLHYVTGPFPEVGARVTGSLDWDHRYKLMRTHTAMHILCGVIWRDYGASVTGGNMEPLKGRMDFEFETMRQELVKEIEESVNAEVANDRPIYVDILPRDIAFNIPDLIRTKINLLPESIQEIRTVEIRGLDLQADGGTHVARTSEVGRMIIPEYKSKGRINKRIYVDLEE